MSSRDQILFLEDILEAIQFIEEFTRDLDYSDFINDRKTFDAVIRNLEVIGEAIKNSKNFRCPKNRRFFNGC
ncbi:MAG: HepT-like ribonuclease domain-containing protein [Methanobacteriaceae archaeon]|nr:HepT-like ribonuclease domain-containing protein [Methanobacteriaceae archaeon]